MATFNHENAINDQRLTYHFMALSWLEHFIGFSLGSIIMASSWYLTKI
jgi:hypothetical protein